MTFLLDAHAVLWSIYLTDRLSQQAHNLIRDENNTRRLSEATQWELLNKVGRGRIEFAGSSVPSVIERIRDLQVDLIPILLEDTIASAMLPHHHSDPFDRILIAQSMRLNCPILTRDSIFATYGVQAIW